MKQAVSAVNSKPTVEPIVLRNATYQNVIKSQIAIWILYSKTTVSVKSD